ncbi:MAG: O-antigen ligase family protein [Nitrospira sp.]|mgnify:CR=1 FL=1|nr:O-antigen ligase family protein [Nitrospira sp.]
MVTTQNLQGVNTDLAKPTNSETTTYPPAFLEYAWYISLVYATLGQVWGIVIPSVGGIVLVFVAVGCWLSISDQALKVYKPIAWALWTGILMIAIQVLFHKESTEAWAEGIIFVNWIALLIIVQSLALRPQFLHRFSLVALAIGLAALPYLNVRTIEGVSRAWASGTGISNPNTLGMWFGFCTVYFIFWGLKARRMPLRIVSWVTALGCLYIITLTVSRAPLLAVALACVVGLRPVLKRNFLPLLLLILLVSIVYASGFFDEKIEHYMARGTEQSGRERLWPAALDRIFESLWIGVGFDGVRIPFGHNRFMIPHNALLHIALASGIIPVICFGIYLSQVGIGTLRIIRRSYLGELALLPPLVVFALFETMMLDFAFMSPWTAVAFGLAIGACRSDRHRES